MNTEQKLREALAGALATLESLRKPGVLAGRDATIADHYPDNFALGRVRDALALPPTPVPRIVIVMDGGLIQTVNSDQPVEVVKIDYDTEGCSDEDGVVELQDVADDGTLIDNSEDAFITNIGADLAPAYVATRFTQCKELNP